MLMKDDRVDHGSPPIAPILAAGVVLGVGLGGFFDGIVFHQLLQWHHMLTSHGDYPMNTVPGLEVNTTWDGIFHATTWLATVGGLGLLWRAERMYDLRWSLVLLGALLIGWGGFNLVEGVIDHHILGIHHVRDDKSGPIEWDLGFLAWGALMLAGGWGLVRIGQRRPHEATAVEIPRRGRYRPRALR
jgi:uncharacterized membrane protein